MWNLVSIFDIIGLLAALISKQNNISTYKQAAEIWQRDRAAGWVSFGQKWKTIFYRRSILKPHFVADSFRTKKLCSRLSLSEVQY